MTRPEDSQRLGNLAFYAAVLLVAYLGYQIVQPFLIEIAWAAVLAICLAPVQDRLSRRIGWLRSAVLLTVLTLLLLFLPALAAVTALVQKGPALVDYVHGQLNDRGGPMGLFHLVWDWLHQRLPFLPPEEDIVSRASASIGGFAGGLASRAGSVVKGAVSVVFSLLLTLGILFFLLKDQRALAAAAPRLLPFGRAQNERLLTLMRDIVSASVTSTLAIAIIQGILGAIAFLALGVPGAALWAGVMTVLALLPAVGSALVWAPAAIWLAVSGSLVKGIVLAAVGVLILGNVDNVVRPLLLSGSARMNTLVLIISLLGGVSAFGFIGIVLGPVVAAVFTALVESYQLPAEEAAVASPASDPALAAAGASSAAVGPAAAVGPVAGTPPPAEPPSDVPRPQK
jgi:predicted PurR-regulated permease PerM